MELLPDLATLLNVAQALGASPVVVAVAVYVLRKADRIACAALTCYRERTASLAGLALAIERATTVIGPLVRTHSDPRPEGGARG